MLLGSQMFESMHIILFIDYCWTTRMYKVWRALRWITRMGESSSYTQGAYNPAEGMKETYSASGRGLKWWAGSQLEKIASHIPMFQHHTHRYSIILKLGMLPKGPLKCQQTGNISQVKNDAKISRKEGWGREWWALWHKTCFSMLHWILQVPKAELRGMWQLLIGYRNSQEGGGGNTHPLGCVTCILSVEHSMKETVAPSGEKKQRMNVCDSFLKSIIGRQTNAKICSLPVIRAEFWCSMPPKINCSVTEQAIHRLSILSCLKGISSSKEDVKLPSSLKAL